MFFHVVTVVSLRSGSNFPHLSNTPHSFPSSDLGYLVSSGWIFINVITAVLLSSGFGLQYVVNPLFQKVVDGFSCVVTAHLISSGWICCHCCFTNQWM